MIGKIQIAVDCADPHALNDFWAETVGYTKEDHHEQVEELLKAGQLPADESITRNGRLAFKTAAACVDPDGAGPRLLFQSVPEGNMPEARAGIDRAKQTRLHLDLHVGDRRDAVIASCLERGATKLWDGQQGPQTWVTLADPEGNEFCVSE
jgi:hypothetical protein